MYMMKHNIELVPLKFEQMSIILGSEAGDHGGGKSRVEVMRINLIFNL